MEKRRLGRLGHHSSVLIYGAAALGDVSQDVADRSISQALDRGINHIDVAADYGDAELRLGPWVAEIRDRVFLATKTGCRDAESAWVEINRSLERLQTDHIDLLQLHAVGDLGELDLATRPGGALEAAIRAQEAGLVGAVGITGHGHEVCRQDAGLMTIKTVSRRNWPEGAAHTYSTWCEPYDAQDRITAAVSWALSHDEVTGIPTAGDVGLLGMLLEAEQHRIPPTEAEQRLRSDDSYASPFLAMPF